MRELEQYRFGGIRRRPGSSSVWLACMGDASGFRLFRTLSTILPACFLIFLCLISIAFVLPSFLFNEHPQPPLHGPITFRFVIILFAPLISAYLQIVMLYRTNGYGLRP